MYEYVYPKSNGPVALGCTEVCMEVPFPTIHVRWTYLEEIFTTVENGWNCRRIVPVVDIDIIGVELLGSTTRVFFDSLVSKLSTGLGLFTRFLCTFSFLYEGEYNISNEFLVSSKLVLAILGSVPRGTHDHTSVSRLLTDS
jgi:hypothetical protein